MIPTLQIGGLGRARKSSGASAPANAFDPAVVSPAAVLTLANLHLAANTGAAGTYANSRSVRATDGLCYFSLKVNHTGSGGLLASGIADSTLDVTNGSNWAGMAGSTSLGVWSSNGNVLFNGSTIGNIGAIAAPDQVEIALRVATRRVWVRQAGGAWLGGGDPAADTTPTATLSGSGDIYVMGTVVKSGSNSSWYIELNPDAAATTGVVPSGFTAAGWL